MKVGLLWEGYGSPQKNCALLFEGVFFKPYVNTCNHSYDINKQEKKIPSEYTQKMWSELYETG